MPEEPNDNATLPDVPDVGRWGVQYPPGTSIDRYVILQPLGRGATAAVYAAYDPELDRRVALKFLLPAATEGTDSNALQARLLLEARAMARISHPNVVTLYQVGTAPEGCIYLAMELVEGGSMSAWLKAGRRGWREIVAVLCQAGEGLAAAHHADMIHRDFKIDNVLVRSDGRAQVTDFGIVWAARDRTPSEDRETAPITRKPRDTSAVKTPSQAPSLSFPRLTVTGSMLGTPGYMAPEQYTMDAPLDVRTDVFGFCATLYRALYGKRPFEGEHLDEVADATLHGRVREVPARSEVPRWIHKIILWGLSVDPEARPTSMEVVLAALRNDPARRPWRPWPWSRWGWGRAPRARGACGFASRCPIAWPASGTVRARPQSARRSTRPASCTPTTPGRESSRGSRTTPPAGRRRCTKRARRRRSAGTSRRRCSTCARNAWASASTSSRR
jgi:serine/threonine protein kinase